MSLSYKKTYILIGILIVGALLSSIQYTYAAKPSNPPNTTTITQTVTLTETETITLPPVTETITIPPVTTTETVTETITVTADPLFISNTKTIEDLEPYNYSAITIYDNTPQLMNFVAIMDFRNVFLQSFNSQSGFQGKLIDICIQNDAVGNECIDFQLRKYKDNFPDPTYAGKIFLCYSVWINSHYSYFNLIQISDFSDAYMKVEYTNPTLNLYDANNNLIHSESLTFHMGNIIWWPEMLNSSEDSGSASFSFVSS